MKHNNKISNKLGFSLVEIAVVLLIVGILVSAITTGLDLVKKSKLSSAKNLATNAPIHAMTDLTLWLESSLPDNFPVGVAAEGEDVTQWSTLSPFMGNIAFTTSGTLPKYKYSSAINDIPSIVFASDSTVDISPIASFITNKELSIFIVERRDNSIGTKNIVNSTDEDIINVSYSAGNISSKIGANTVLAAVATSDGTNLHYISLSKSTISSGEGLVVRSGVNYYLNKRITDSLGMPVADAAQAGTAVISSNATNLTIGASANGFVGNIAEVIIFTKILKKDEMLDVFDYLQAKYKLSLSSS